MMDICNKGCKIAVGFIRTLILRMCGIAGIAVLPESGNKPQEATKPQWKFSFDFMIGQPWNAKDGHWEITVGVSNQLQAQSIAIAEFNRTHPDAHHILREVERVDAGRHIKPKRKRPAKTAPGYIYLIEGLPGHYKIGLTVDPKERIGTLGVQLPYPIRVIHLIPAENMEAAENHLHDLFRGKRVRGEWFELDEQEVAFIKGIDHLGSELLQ